MRVCDRCGHQALKGEWVAGNVHPGWDYGLLCWVCHMKLDALEEKSQVSRGEIVQGEEIHSFTVRKAE